jgi:hypothetical protein
MAYEFLTFTEMVALFRFLDIQQHVKKRAVQEMSGL